MDEFPMFDVISDSEEAIKTIDDPKTREVARAKIASIIHNHKQILQSQQKNIITLTLQRIYFETKRFLKLHPNVMVVNSDKGKSVVLINKEHYMTKVKSLLDDKTTYKLLNADPTDTLQTVNNKLVNKLYTGKIITKQERTNLTTYNSTSPKLYVLPKVHKIDIPVRPIVASVDTVSSKMSKLLANVLKHLTVDVDYTIKNSFEFKNKLVNTTIEPNETMVSFDVVSLFTNIPTKLALEIVNEKWEILSKITTIPKQIFLEMLKFCLVDANYFVFNKCHYKQIYGMPMGNPLSSIIADIVLNRLLDVTLAQITPKPKLFVKYVDDMFAILPNSIVNNTLISLNVFHEKLKFTIETEENGCLPYLDVLVVRNNDNTISTNWFKKEITSNRILNFYSHHPFFQKTNTARNYISRILTLSSKKYHHENKQMIYNTLIHNNYPHNTIMKLIRAVTTQISNSVTNNEKTENTIKKYRSMTYVKTVSEKIEKVIRTHTTNTQLAYKNNKCLRNVFAKLKDPVPLSKRTNVIYRIPCRGDGNGEPCDKSYVGQTKQYLEKRLQNHRRDLRLGNDSTPKTALVDHFHNLNHYPDFNAVTVLDTQRNLSKRLTIEALHIYTQNTYNVKRYTDNISSVFCNIIDNITQTQLPKKKTIQ